jgi:hypothetical protein
MLSCFYFFCFVFCLYRLQAEEQGGEASSAGYGRKAVKFRYMYPSRKGGVMETVLL